MSIEVIVVGPQKISSQLESNRSNDDVIDAAHPDRLLKDSPRTSLSRHAASAQ